jgi:hypothetical protein
VRYSSGLRPLSEAGLLLRISAYPTVGRVSHLIISSNSRLGHLIEKAVEKRQNRSHSRRDITQIYKGGVLFRGFQTCYHCEQDKTSKTIRLVDVLFAEGAF